MDLKLEANWHKEMNFRRRRCREHEILKKGGVGSQGGMLRNQKKEGGREGEQWMERTMKRKRGQKQWICRQEQFSEEAAA